MAEFYSRADRDRMAQGLDPLPNSTLTVEDYKDILALAMEEAKGQCRAGSLIGNVEIKDMGNVHAGLTSSNRGADGKLTGKYDVSIDWSDGFQARLGDPGDGKAYFSQRLTSVFHEFRHVEQHGMVAGGLPVKTKEDMEVATQMVVNSMYPSLYSRGYENTISEVDADTYGVQDALAFVDRHPELKERYGFDFRKEIMRTDEYDVLPDATQLKSRPEDLVTGMMRYRRQVYSDPWKPLSNGRTPNPVRQGSSEEVFLRHLEETRGVGMEQLERMDNDERNVLLIQNAMEVMGNDAYKGRIASNIRAYSNNPILSDRYDVVLRDFNDEHGQVIESQEDRVLEFDAAAPVFDTAGFVRYRTGQAQVGGASAVESAMAAKRNREILSRFGHLLDTRQDTSDLHFDAV